MLRFSVLAICLILFLPLSDGFAQKKLNKRIPTERIVELDTPYACSWLPRRSRYTLVRVRRYRENRRGESIAVVSKITRKDIRTKTRKRNRLIRKIERLSQRLASRPGARRLNRRLERLQNRLARVREIPDLAQRCSNLMGPPGELSSCLDNDLPASISFVPGRLRTKSLSNSASCQGEVFYEVLSGAPGANVHLAGTTLTIQSDQTVNSEIALRKCITLTDGNWTCLEEENVALTPCSISSQDQSFELPDGENHRLELSINNSCDGASTISITTPPQHSSIVGVEAEHVNLETKYSLGTDTFEYRSCNLSHDFCGETSLVSLQVVQGEDFRGNPESLSPYREYISANERRHLIWKLSLNSAELLSGEGSTLSLSDFITERLLNKEWLPESTAKELAALRDQEFKFPVASQQDPFIIDMPDIGSPEAPPAGTLIPLYSEEEQFLSHHEINEGIERFLSVSARSFHAGLSRYFWGFPQTGGYTLFRSRYLQPTAGTMLHFLMTHFGTAGSTITGAEELWVGDYLNHLNRYSLGNFRELIRGKTPSGCSENYGIGTLGEGQGMICNSLSNFWLDNQSNTPSTPNENFAREFMEIYTLGIEDPISGMKNYSDIDDVVAATSFMSGIHEDPSPPIWKGLMRFNTSRHSQNPQSIFTQFSQQYPALALEDASLTPAEFTDHLFDNHPGVARYIAKKVFSMLVYPEPSDEIVEELAFYFKDQGFDLHKLLMKIARSEAMFSKRAAERNCVSSPFQSFAKTINGLQLSLASIKSAIGGVCHNHQRCQQKFFNAIQEDLSFAGEALLDFPDVFGYDYCGEDDGKDGSGAWLTSANLLSRTVSMISFISSHNKFIQPREDLGVITRFKQLQQFMSPSGAEETIQPEDVIYYFKKTFSLKLDQQEHDILYEYLTHDWISGAPQPTEWNPADDAFMEEKLAGLTAIVSSLAQSNIH